MEDTERLRQYIMKASFSHSADKNAALECLERLRTEMSELTIRLALEGEIIMAFSKVVYGPQGCGKTLNAEKIAKALGMKYIIDDWDGQRRTFASPNTLHLTYLTPDQFPWLPQSKYDTLTYEEAMELVKTGKPQAK